MLEVQDQQVDPPGPDQVRVTVAAAGVNFIDVYKRQGVYPQPTPFVLGEEGAGVVAAVGSHVQSLVVGDKVAWAQAYGSMAEEVNVPAEAVVRVPGGLDLQVAAAAMLQGITAHYLTHSTYAVQPGDVALVHAAAGGVGQLLVQLITAAGATVVATAGTDEKLRVAGRLGAAHLINYRQFDGNPDNLAARVRQAAGRGVDVVYDGVGQATFEASLRSLRPRGILVLFGAASGQVPPIDLEELDRHGSLFATRPTAADYIRDREELEWHAREILNSLTDGSLHLQIGGTYPFDHAADAYDALEGRKSMGKLILVP